MKNVIEIVDQANVHFYNKLSVLDQGEPLSREQYVRYLRMQYHLTNGVQESFLALASHPETRKYSSLRKFLIQFAYEEEMHYRLAEKDLEDLGETPGEIPFLVEVWWQYQRKIIKDNPFQRLGTTCILENIGNHSAGMLKKVLSEAPFISKKNTSFIMIHMHEVLPHGDQIVEALESAKLSETHQKELVQGAVKGSWLYSNIIDWVLDGDAFMN